jgi:hypothetical protein
MKRIIIEDFRGFHDRVEVPILPLTFLVGENSAGKSSFLAAIRIAFDLAKGKKVNFNEDPFLLGSYDQIANFRGGKAGRAKCFSIGSVWDSIVRADIRRARMVRDGESIEKSLGSEVKIVTKFSKSSPGPRPSAAKIKSGSYSVSVSADYFLNGQIGARINISDGERKIPTVSITDPDWTTYDYEPVINWRELHYLIKSEDTDGGDLSELETRQLSGFLSVADHSLRRSSSFRQRPIAHAPIRSKPARTYDPQDSEWTAEGTHVPLQLARLFFREENKWRNFVKDISEFGKESGLFSDIKIRSFGKNEEGTPFQIQVKNGGPYTNIIDVGYGVSQSLPILSEINRKSICTLGGRPRWGLFWRK